VHPCKQGIIIIIIIINALFIAQYDLLD